VFQVISAILLILEAFFALWIKITISPPLFQLVEAIQAEETILKRNSRSEKMLFALFVYVYLAVVKVVKCNNDDEDDRYLCKSIFLQFNNALFGIFLSLILRILQRI
jgi:hypothetical protein